LLLLGHSGLKLILLVTIPPAQCHNPRAACLLTLWFEIPKNIIIVKPSPYGQDYQICVKVRWVSGPSS